METTGVLVILMAVILCLSAVVVVLGSWLRRDRSRLADAEGMLASARAQLEQQRQSDASMRSMDDLLRPVREGLENLRQVTDRVGRERSAAEATITTTLAGFADRYATLEEATATIAAALSKGQTRGQWGEMQLERLLEHAGLLEGTHFARQQTRAGADGASRPDVVVMLPGGGEILVDAKFPFDAYWQSVSAAEPAQRTALLAKHAADTLARVRELSSKRYSDSDASPDFVVMFLPLESLLSTALEADGLLLERAFERHVVLATPTTMLALLRTVAFGYQRSRLAENAEQIRAAGAEMLQRLGVLVEHLDALRRGLDQAVRGYNAFVGSFDRQALRQARRLNDLGVDATRALDAPAEIDVALRLSDPVALRD